LGSDRLAAAGLNREHANLVADVLTHADLRGVRSHGVMRTEHYVKRLNAGSLNKNPTFSFKQIQSGASLLNADGGMGHAACDLAMNHAIDLASKTGIARVYNKAMKLTNDELAFDDFTSYEPSYNTAASFIATPIFINNKREGVLIFQMPVDEINKIMSFNGEYVKAGLGESGESYLIGSDYTMKNNSRFTNSIDDPIVKSLQSTIGVLKVVTDSTKAVIEENKKNGQWIINDYRGVPVLSVFDTITIFNETKWIILAEIDEEEALRSSVNLRNKILIISLFGVIILMLVLQIILQKYLIKPIDIFQKSIVEISQNQDLTLNVNTSAPKEISEMAHSFNTLIKNLQDLISIAIESSTENAIISNKLSETSSDVGKNVEYSVKTVKETQKQVFEFEDEIKNKFDLILNYEHRYYLLDFLNKTPMFKDIFYKEKYEK